MERIGTYEVKRLIAHGGTATVYEARQPALDRTVALKRLDLRLNDPVLVKRFIHESRIAASFDHPNIVTVHDFFEYDGVPYIAMEYLPRGSLRPWVRHVTTAQAIGALEGILAALRHAEQSGIAHRDLKPENVLLTESGGVKIADFGIAKAYTRATEHFTSTGTSVGTPTYMAPEQAQGRQVGPFTDLYAVGVIAFELLRGSPPFAGSSSVATLYRHVNEVPPSLADLKPDVDPRLAAWVARLLEKDPAARPASARDAWARLEELAVSLLGPFWRRDAPIGAAWEPAETVAGPRSAATLAAGSPAPAGKPAMATAATVESEPDAAGPATAAAVARAIPLWRRRRVRALASAVAVVGVAGVAMAALRQGGDTGTGGQQRAAASAGARAVTRAVAPYDFRGNGHPAIVAGIPGWRPRGAPAGGAITVLGSPGVITERSLALPGADAAGDRFGAAVASGDFDGDGRADLAVGAPGRNTGDRGRLEGAVTVLRGTAAGVGRAAATFRGPGIDLPYRAASYGAALAAGDLDRDGYADLAVGAPGSDALPAGTRGSGAVEILFGSATGLARSRARTLRRPRDRDRRFGSLLRLADVDRDGHLDVVEAAPGAPAGSGPGHASYCPGGQTGPVVCRPMATPGAAQPASLAVGDVTGDGFPDVVQGVPGYGPATAGALLLWRGTPRGPSPKPLTISQETPGIPGNDQRDDGFGTAVALADIDRDGFADLVTGAPGEDGGAGRVTLIFGGAAGYATLGARVYVEGRLGMPGRKGHGERFGAALQILDTTGDRRPELIVGAPGDGGALVTIPGINGRFARARSTVFPLARLPGRLAAGEPEIRLGG